MEANKSTEELKVSEATRRDIFDLIFESRYQWNGRLDEDDFIQKVFQSSRLALSDLDWERLLSHINYAVVQRTDWDRTWIRDNCQVGLLNCDPDRFLHFLTWTLHPVVQRDTALVTGMAAKYNDLLRYDGVELAPAGSEAGRPVFAARQVAGNLPQMAAAKQSLGQPDKPQFRDQLRRMENSVENEDPAAAIGAAKELLESCCKQILAERGVEYSASADLPALMRLVTELLKLRRDDIPDAKPSASTVKTLLSNLTTVVNGLAELRNTYGTGHGPLPTTKPPGKRHARLAVGAALTLALFLTETSEERKAGLPSEPQAGTQPPEAQEQ